MSAESKKISDISKETKKHIFKLNVADLECNSEKINGELGVKNVNGSDGNHCNNHQTGKPF